MKCLYTRRFVRSFNKLPKDVQEEVLHAVTRFQQSPRDTSLQLHKLSGDLKKFHAFSANFAYRIIVYIKKDTAQFVTVGSHDIYR
ncbi:MAG: hypothetical protein Greene07147_788 [Parcubacteria group bacterium Greene0714_7]|nr:MAG: hypothetical protein Greene07147_788 [Parcubacteria group bacterium Greene0714_7]